MKATINESKGIIQSFYHLKKETVLCTYTYYLFWQVVLNETLIQNFYKLNVFMRCLLVMQCYSMGCDHIPPPLFGRVHFFCDHLNPMEIQVVSSLFLIFIQLNLV